MALLGGQLVITLVMVSIIQKLNSHFSFAKWLLCSTGLKRFLYPSNLQLKTLAGIPKDKKTKNYEYDTFHIPRNLNISLESSEVTALDVVHLRYFTEYQWLIDFSIYAVIVFMVSEVHNFYFPLKNELNLSIIWCLLVVFFSLKLLGNLTILYFNNDESVGERSMCLLAFFFYMLIAMVLVTVDENILETGLERAYSSFNTSASVFLREQGISSTGPASEIVLKFFLCFYCGLCGSIYTFPGLRMARMHSDSMRYCREKKYLQILLNLSFSLPLILVILWIRPISRDYLTVRIFNGAEKPLLTQNVFETVRLFIIIFAVILRFTLMPIYLQSYLNIAYDRTQNLKTEAGRITNTDLQKKVSSIFYYLCVISLQFAAPLILSLYLTLIYKNLGNFSWIGIVVNDDYANEIVNSVPQSISIESNSQVINIVGTTEKLNASWINLKQVFSVDVWKGLLGFATWWSYFTLFTSSAIGILYQSYFRT